MKKFLHWLGFHDWKEKNAFRKCRICETLEHFDSTPYLDGHWEYVGNISKAVEDYNNIKTSF